MTETVYILLGSNVGDREKYLETALERLESLEGLEITASSGIYISEAKDMQGENPSFLNQVVKADWWYKANELLHAMEKIERDLGRAEKGKKQPRTIDIDLLLFGEQIIDTEYLRVPHEHLLSRPFAMVPLLQIDPQLRHPAGKRPIAEFLSDEDRKTVMLYKDHVARNI